MKITELASKHQINDKFIIAFMSELKSEYGENSKIFKKAKQICSEFYNYDDPDLATRMTIKKLKKLNCKIETLALLRIS